MRHLNTGIRNHRSQKNSSDIVHYFLSLGANRFGNAGDATGDDCYYLCESVNLQCAYVGSSYLKNVKLFNSIEEHKAYMNQTKIIQIW